MDTIIHRNAEFLAALKKAAPSVDRIIFADYAEDERLLAHVADEAGETTPLVDLTEWAEGIVARLDYLASQELLDFCQTPDGFSIRLTYSGWNFREFHRAKRSDFFREKLMWPVIVSVVSYGMLELIKWLVGRVQL